MKPRAALCLFALARASLEADDECAAGAGACALSALQTKKAVLRPAGCGSCLFACAPGEASNKDGKEAFLACAARLCGLACLASEGREDPRRSALYADGYKEGLKAPGTAGDNGGWGEWLRKVSWLKEDLLKDVDVAALEDVKRFRRDLPLYSTVQTMSHDRLLYDPENGAWTAERYLADLEERFGGVDQLLIWPGYPNIGADARNQLEMLEAMPGGLAACFAALRAARPKLQLQITYMPWDILTHGSGERDPERYAAKLAEVKADGFNLDTMFSGGPFTGGYLPVSLYYEAARKAGLPDLVIEPELGLTDGTFMLNVTQQSWLYHLSACEAPCARKAAFAPRLSLQKWLARRSMPHICQRWSKQRSQEILTAYFNAIGFTPWENIFGNWNGINAFDGELLKRALAVLRHYHLFLSDPKVAWLPYYPLSARSARGRNVYASKFVGENRELWLLVNTGLEDADGEDWELPASTAKGELYDLFTGETLGSGRASVKLEAHGIGAVLRTPQPTAGDRELMARLAEMARRPLHSFSGAATPVLQQELLNPALPVAPLRAAAGAVRVPGSGAFSFRAYGAVIEDAYFYRYVKADGSRDASGSQPTGADIQYPWEATTTKYHEAHVLPVPELWVDRHPVTNGDFAEFLRASGYEPKDGQNFLRHWGCEGGGAGGCRPPEAVERQPVVHVSLEDARAYCAFRGKRLPREWEWQHAAQGGDPERLYPWGNEWRRELMPPAQASAEAAAMSDVGGYPGGASRHGVEDLVGLVWHWTDEYGDERNRAAVLRGGPAYQPGVAGWRYRYQPWYFPGQAMPGKWQRWDDRGYWYLEKDFASLYRLTTHAKYLLMAPSLDRAATIGFRCVAEAA